MPPAPAAILPCSEPQPNTQGSLPPGHWPATSQAIRYFLYRRQDINYQSVPEKSNDGVNFQSPPGDQRPKRAADPATLLTQRQQQVALLIAHGLTNREIGQRLELSVFTVRNEVIGVMRRLGARNRSHVAFMVGRSKLGELSIFDLAPTRQAS